MVTPSSSPSRLAGLSRFPKVGVFGPGRVLGGGAGERRDEGYLHIGGHGVHLQGEQHTALAERSIDERDCLVCR